MEPMFFSIDWWRQHYGLVSVTLSLLVGIAMLYLQSKFVTKVEHSKSESDVSTRLRAVEAQVKTMEAQVMQVATKEDLHRIELMIERSIGGQNAKIAEIRIGQAQTAEAIGRIEDLMLEKGAALETGVMTAPRTRPKRRRATQ